MNILKNNLDNFGLAEWTKNVKESEIRRLLKYNPPYYFAGGKPGNLPLQALGDILNEIFEDIQTEINQKGPFSEHHMYNYGTSEGYTPLREVLANRLRKRERINLSQNDGWKDLIITTGSQQALYGVLHTVLNPNDIIIASRPTYLGFIGPSSIARANIITVPTDDKGMIPEAVESACINSQNILARRPKILYVQTFSDNPKGITLTHKRKQQLFDIAEEWNMLIIEDVAYKEIDFNRGPLDRIEPIKSFDKENSRVIYLGTTSKEVAVLRIGYTIMPDKLRSQFIKIKGYLDLCTPTITQEIARKYYQDKINDYLPKVVSQYAKQANAMKEAIDAHLPGIRTNPTGGFFIWQKWDHPTFNASKLLPTVLEKGVLFVPGVAFYPEDGFAIDDDCSSFVNPISFQNEIRLSYSSSSPDDIHKGIEILGNAMRSNEL